MTEEHINRRKITNQILAEIIVELTQNNSSIRVSTVMKRINDKLDAVGGKTYSEATVRRYMAANNLVPQKGSNGAFIYSPLKSIIETPQAIKLNVHDFLCYTITPACFTPQIADALNQEFKGKIFKAIALGDTLLCLYINKNNYEWNTSNDEIEECVNFNESKDKHDVSEEIVSEEDEYNFDYESTLSPPEINSILFRLMNHYKHLDPDSYT